MLALEVPLCGWARIPQEAHKGAFSVWPSPECWANKLWNGGDGTYRLQCIVTVRRFPADSRHAVRWLWKDELRVAPFARLCLSSAGIRWWGILERNKKSADSLPRGVSVKALFAQFKRQKSENVSDDEHSTLSTTIYHHKRHNFRLRKGKA